jgi:hypothetical protein
MKKIIGIILLTTVLSCTTGKFDPGNIIIWQENRKLIWDDFKGKPVTNSEYVAVTNCDNVFVYKTYTDSIELKFYAYFSIFDSWVNTSYKNNSVLNHEQVHFDIAALYSKIEKKYFADNMHTYSKDNILVEIRKIHFSYRIQKDQMESLYDLETNHGTNYIKQIEWNKKIRDGLDTLNNITDKDLVFRF